MSLHLDIFYKILNKVQIKKPGNQCQSNAKYDEFKHVNGVSHKRMKRFLSSLLFFHFQLAS